MRPFKRKADEEMEKSLLRNFNQENTENYFPFFII